MPLHEQLSRLRISKNFSQEKLANELNVSRQAVQKWETGTGTPELENLIKISRYFNVSLDSLVQGGGDRSTEHLRGTGEAHARYDQLRARGEYYPSVLMLEYQQCLEEGRDVHPYEALFDAVSHMPEGYDQSRIAEILHEIAVCAPELENYPYREPNELRVIRTLCAPAQAMPRPCPARVVLQERVLGAVCGRMAGCLLGKPIEGIHTDELYPLLKESGNWPLHRYLRSTDVTPERAAQSTFHFSGRRFVDTVACAPNDDDTNYVLLAQILIDRYGRDFTSADVGRLWLDFQPKKAFYTAERVAYINLSRGLVPPDSAQDKNPFRERIGAQIRADYFGYINPGDPATAAEMAWRDGRVSHVKNGIYGEMMVAAMLAEAAVETSLEKIVRAGLSQIPTTSRLHKAITGILEGWRRGVSRHECFLRIHQRFDEHLGHDWCHVLSNAMVVAASLLYGGGDFGASICMAVETGFDTDSNGATVGSILGMRGGIRAIGEEWLKPLNGRMDTSLSGTGQITIEELVEKTMTHMPSAAGGQGTPERRRENARQGSRSERTQKEV